MKAVFIGEDDHEEQNIRIIHFESKSRWVKRLKGIVNTKMKVVIVNGATESSRISLKRSVFVFWRWTKSL